MKFITVMSAKKALKFIDNLELENNLVFDFPEDVLENLKLKLEDLTGMLTTPVVGVVCPNDDTLKQVWENVSTLLPVKSGDVVFQFRLPDDQLLYGDFNSVMALLYYPNGDTVDDVFDYNIPNVDKCVALVNEVKTDSFESAYILDSDWEKNAMESPSNLHDINTLKSLCNSSIFGG